MSGAPIHDARVRSRLRDEYGDLTPTQRRLAEFLLENLAVASDFTITDLASAAGVSIGTISQLCRRLGLKGYQDLRLALARDAVVLEASAAGQRLEISAGPPEVRDAIARVFGSSQDALTETATRLDPATLERAVALLVEARRIECVGVGTAGLVAAEAALKLRKLGLDSISLADTHQQAMSAALLDERDVLLAISHSGRTIDTLRAAQVARAGGAHVIVISGQVRSPLADAADVLFVTVSADTGFQVEPMASTVAAIAVIQVLFVLLMERTGSAQDQLSMTQAAVEDRHITGRSW
jgi:RpiR family transcriptional regulator, carbohydrate utilization regulator